MTESCPLGNRWRSRLVTTDATACAPHSRGGGRGESGRGRSRKRTGQEPPTRTHTSGDRDTDRHTDRNHHGIFQSHHHEHEHEHEERETSTQRRTEAQAPGLCVCAETSQALAQPHTRTPQIIRRPRRILVANPRQLLSIHSLPFPVATTTTLTPYISQRVPIRLATSRARVVLLDWSPSDVNVESA